MDESRLVSASGPVYGSARIPPSKSLTHRALILASLAGGRSRLENALLAEDSVRTARALRAMGARFDAQGPGSSALRDALDPARSFDATALAAAAGGDEGLEATELAIEITGFAGRPRAPLGTLDVGGSGTTMRLLTAVASLAPGETVLDGDARMRERPIGPLLEALASLGVEARSIPSNGCPPVCVRGHTLRGGEARFAGDQSSQFASALLMVAPLAPRPATITVLPPIVSRPYIDLTAGTMSAFGIDAVPGGGADATPGRWSDRREEFTGAFPQPAGMKSGSQVSERRIRVPGAPAGGAAMVDRAGELLRYEFPGGQGYCPARLRIPPDATSASYLLAAAAATGGRVRVEGLLPEDPQGDVVFLDYLRTMGCTVTADERGTTVAGPAGEGRRGRALRDFDLDLGSTPDLVPTMAVLALFAQGSSRIRNVAHLRLKESDRLRVLAEGLCRLGAAVEEEPAGLRIVPGPVRPARIETRGDHRMAMAFAVAGLVAGGVRIEEPGCVAKSFPAFWSTLEALTRQAR